MKSNLLLLLAACCILDGVASDDRGADVKHAFKGALEAVVQAFYSVVPGEERGTV